MSMDASEACATLGCPNTRERGTGQLYCPRCRQRTRDWVASKAQTLAVTTPADVADLFVATCERLCAMGATRVEGFGLVACFGPKPLPSSPRAEPEQQMPSGLTPDQQQLWMRSRSLLGGGGVR